jgi:probable F420-dependent oxidoreductase
LEGVPVEITVALPTTGNGASPEAIRTVAVEAESRGWRTVWTVERLLFPDPTMPGATHASDHYRVVFDPLDSIAWAAAYTSTLRFGTSILNALFHPPVVLARRLATVDRLSEGRLVVGLGQGWMPEEFEAAGVPMSRRGNGFEDYLAALTSVWGPDPVSYEGRFYRIPRSYLAPKPSQAGGPPVLIGAVAPLTAARAGRLGFGLNLVMVSWEHFEQVLDAWRKARVAAGHDAAAPVVVRTNTIVGSETNEIGEIAGRGTKAGADLRRLADYNVDEVFFETGRGPMRIAEQLDLVDEWRSELRA